MALTRDGGKPNMRELNYSPPQGPTTFSHSGPGLANHDSIGRNGTQGKSGTPASSSGSVGIGGENCGNCGTQGRY